MPPPQSTLALIPTADDDYWDLSSEGSDLTELSSSEDEAEKAPPPVKPLRKSSRAQSKESKEYQVEGQLKPPRSTSYSVEHIFSQIERGDITLDPEYQRDVVWSEAKQVGLIDSLLRNYYIPPVIFAVRYHGNRPEKRICIDGKQRLTSIYNFMKGEIFHKANNKRYWYAKDDKSSRKTLLPASLIQSFCNKQVVCVEYNDLTEDQERQIFQRVQLGVPLTPAERMQALTGPWATLVREIKNEILGENGFGQFVEWDRSRGREFSCIATILHLIGQKKKIFPGTPQIEKLLNQQDAVPADYRETALQTFKIYKLLAEHPIYSACFQEPQQRVSPMEVIMIGVLVHTRREELTMTELSSAISKMRADVRKKHTDVRSNGKVSKTMWTFIAKTHLKRLENSREDLLKAVEYMRKHEHEIEVRGREALAMTQVQERRASSQATKVTGQTEKRLSKTSLLKRKRSESMDVDDEPSRGTSKSMKQLANTQRAKRTGTRTKAVAPGQVSSGSSVKKPQAISSTTTQSDAKGTSPSKSGGSSSISSPSVSARRSLSQHKSDVSSTAIAADTMQVDGPVRRQSLRKVSDRLAPIREAKARITQPSTSTENAPVQASASAQPSSVSTLPQPLGTLGKARGEVLGPSSANEPLPTRLQNECQVPVSALVSPSIPPTATVVRGDVRTVDPRRRPSLITARESKSPVQPSSSASSMSISSDTIADPSPFCLVSPPTAPSLPPPATRSLPPRTAPPLPQPHSMHAPGAPLSVCPTSSQAVSSHNHQPAPSETIVFKRSPTHSPTLPPKPMSISNESRRSPPGAGDARATPAAPRALRAQRDPPRIRHPETRSRGSYRSYDRWEPPPGHYDTSRRSGK